MRKLMAISGIALIVAGLLALAVQQISYSTRETVLNVGPIEATRQVRRTVPLPPVVGIAAVVAGVGVLVLSRKR